MSRGLRGYLLCSGGGGGGGSGSSRSLLSVQLLSLSVCALGLAGVPSAPCHGTYLQLEGAEPGRGRACHRGWNELHGIVITCQERERKQCVQVETMSAPIAGQGKCQQGSGGRFSAAVAVQRWGCALGSQPKHLHGQKAELVRLDED